MNGNPKPSFDDQGFVLDTRKRFNVFGHPAIRTWNSRFEPLRDNVTPEIREELRISLLKFTTFCIVKPKDILFLRSPDFIAYLRGVGNRFFIEYIKFGPEKGDVAYFKFWVYRNKMQDLGYLLQDAKDKRVDREQFLERLFNWE